jgi:oligopeptide transport system substrate-binding protein
MKKLLALLLTVAMVLSLAACGPNTDQTTQAPAQTTQAPDQTKAPDQPTQAPDQPTQAPDQPTTAPEPEGKKTLNTYETKARELETWNVHYSQAAADLNVLCNLFDGLLTNDNHGNLKLNAAKSYETPDGGKTWIFTLNEGMTWFNKDGEKQADVVASDWATGLEWVLNYAKNDSYNVSMPAEMIVGANDYYEYTKALTESDGAEAAKALTAEDGSKFAEMVGIAVDDAAGTITYTLIDQLPYFPSVATYNCLYPLSAELIEELGVDGYRDVTWENMWYSGAYTVTYFVSQNQKVLTKSPNYWNDANCSRFDTVTIKMVESASVAFQLFKNGELDHVSLDQATLQGIYNGTSDGDLKQYLVESRPTKYSYQIHLVYAKNLEDGTTPDTNWNTAIANENFRKSLYYGLDLTNYFARTNAINPLSCQNFAYTGNGVAFTSDGTDYTKLVLKELGMEYDYTKYTRVNAEAAAQYKAKAMEELTAKGVTFPVTVDYYISGSSDVAAQTAKVLENIFAECLGSDYVVLKTNTYVSSLANEVRKPRKASIFINGWGADFADPINFLGQETYDDPQAYYSNAYSLCNENDDPDLIAAYKEFTDLVVAAKAITNDMDARYAAFAKAEACMLNHALVIPCSYEVGWELTKVNNYTKVYSMYGMQAYRYVDWEVSETPYTTEQMEANADKYNAE